MTIGNGLELMMVLLLKAKCNDLPEDLLHDIAACIDENNAGDLGECIGAICQLKRIGWPLADINAIIRECCD